MKKIACLILSLCISTVSFAKNNNIYYQSGGFFTLLTGTLNGGIHYKFTPTTSVGADVMGGYLGPAVFLDFTPKYSYISKGIDLVEDGEYHGSFFFTIGPNLTMGKFVGKGQANLDINYGIQAEIGYQINIDNLYIKPAITLWANDMMLKENRPIVNFVASSFSKTLLNTISVYFRF